MSLRPVREWGRRKLIIPITLSVVSLAHMAVFLTLLIGVDDVYGGNGPEQRFVDDSKELLGSLASLDLGSEERKASFLELTRRVYDEDVTAFLRCHGQKARDDIHVVLNDNGDINGETIIISCWAVVPKAGKH